MPFIPFIIAAIGLTGIAATIVSVVLGVAVTVGLGFLSRLLAPKPPKPVPVGRDITVNASDAAWQIVYGERVVGGSLFAIETAGVNNEFLYVGIVWCYGGPDGIEEIVEIRFGDEVAVIGTTPISKYAGLITVEHKLGTDAQAASTILTGDLPSRFTSDDKGSGHAYTVLKLKFNEEKFSDFSIEGIRAKIKGRKVFDPRTGIITWTQNPVLAIRDYLSHTRFGLGYGQGLRNLPVILDDAYNNTQANICDELVAKKAGGTRARYAMNMAFTTEAEPGRALQEMFVAMGGGPVYSNGQWRLLAGAWRPPGITLGDGDLRGPVQIKMALGRLETFNGVRGVFVDPTHWQPTNYPVYAPADVLAEDDGIRIWRDLDFTAVTDAGQAQQLAKLGLEMIRRPKRLILPCKFLAYELLPGDTFRFTHDDWVEKTFAVERIELPVEHDEQGMVILGVDIHAREEDPGVYYWNPTADEGTYTAPPSPTFPPPGGGIVSSPSTPPGAPTGLASSGSGAGEFIFIWAAPAGAANTDQLSYRVIIAADSGFTTSVETFADLRITAFTLHKPNVARFWKVDCKYPNSGYGTAATFGAPTAVNSGLVNLDDDAIDGSIYNRVRGAGLLDGRVRLLRRSDAVDVDVDNAFRKNVETLDNVLEGATYGRPKLTALTAGEVDLAKAGVIGKSLVNVADDAGSDRRAATANEKTGGGRGFSAIDAGNIVVAGGVDFARAYTGKQLDNVPDGTTRKGRTAAHSSYRPLSNPLTATDAGASATINIAAFTQRVAGLDISVNSGSITSLSFNTLYFVYYDDASFAGGAVTYVATTTRETALNGPGRFFVSSIITPRDEGADTLGNNDGGIGAQAGRVNTFRPGISSQTTVSTGSVSNRENARDGDDTSFATLTAPGSGTGALAVVEVRDFPGTIEPLKSLLLKVRSEVPTFDTDGPSHLALLQYSIDDGANFTVIFSVTTTRALTLDSVTIPISVNPSRVRVEMSVNEGSSTVGSIVGRCYEVWLEAQT